MMEYGEWTNTGAALLMLVVSGFFLHRLHTLPPGQPKPTKATLWASTLWLALWLTWCLLYLTRQANGLPGQDLADLALSDANSVIMATMGFVLMGRRQLRARLWFYSLSILVVVLLLDALLLLVGKKLLSDQTAMSFVRHLSCALAVAAPITLGVGFAHAYRARSLCWLFVLYAFAQPLTYGSFAVPQDDAHVTVFADLDREKEEELPTAVRKALTLLLPPGREAASPGGAVAGESDSDRNPAAPTDAQLRRLGGADLDTLKGAVAAMPRLLPALEKLVEREQAQLLYEAAVRRSSVSPDSLQRGHVVARVDPAGLNRNERFALLGAAGPEGYWRLWLQLNCRGIFLALLSVLKLLLCAGALQQLQRVPLSKGELDLLGSVRLKWDCYFPGNSHKAWYWSLVALAAADFFLLLYLHHFEPPMLAIGGSVAAIVVASLAWQNRRAKADTPGVDPGAGEVDHQS